MNIIYEKSDTFFRTILKNNHFNGIQLSQFFNFIRTIHSNNSNSNVVNIDPDLDIYPFAHIYPYIYNFSLHPSNNSFPSGSCNFSKIDNPLLILNLNDSAINREIYIEVYGVNYNIFQIKNGLGGLLYSN